MDHNGRSQGQRRHTPSVSVLNLLLNNSNKDFAPIADSVPTQNISKWLGISPHVAIFRAILHCAVCWRDKIRIIISQCQERKTSPDRLRLDYDWDCDLSLYKTDLTNICSLLKQRFVEAFPHGHGRLWPCHRGMQAHNVNFNETIQNLCKFSAKPPPPLPFSPPSSSEQDDS